ncbi:hypothetical protein FB545_2304 [Peribacillus frigoritolerans]|nr:hypothetical protein FB545_2304 [Peribacillus frigoritolerans]
MYRGDPCFQKLPDKHFLNSHMPDYHQSYIMQPAFLRGGRKFHLKLMFDNNKVKETGLSYKSGFFHSAQAESVFFFVVLNSGMVQQRKEPPDLMISLISTSMTSYPRSRS